MKTEPEINLVKKTCKELGITQKELAEKIGVSSQTISDWSNHKTPIPKWGLNIFNLLQTEKEFRFLKKIIRDSLTDSNKTSLTFI